MTKEVYYTYLGTNGTITSPVFLEGIYFVRKYKIKADEDFLLTKDNKNFSRIEIIPEDDLENWKEVPVGQN